MKNRIVALLIAVLLLVSTAAFAEDSTMLYLSIADPIVTVSGQELDLTGVQLFLGGYLTDSGLTALSAGVYSGAEHENTDAAAMLVLNETGLYAAATGISDTYTLDVSKLIPSVDPYQVAAGLALHTAVNSIAGGEAIVPADLLGTVPSDYVTEIADDHVNFAISREQSKALAQASGQNTEFDLTGTVTAISDTEFSVLCSGTAYGTEQGDVPFDVRFGSDSATGTTTIDVVTMGFIVNIAYTGATTAEGNTVENNGVLAIAATQQESNETISLTINITAGKSLIDTSEWEMGVDGDAIDVMTMTDEQMNTVMTEGQTLLFSALGQLAADVPMIGALMG